MDLRSLERPTYERLGVPHRLKRSYNGGTMNGFSLHTPEQVSDTLAARIKALRLTRGWKQATLAERSGVSLASLRRFEATGRASLQHLLALAFALNRLDDFDALLQAPRASSLAELEAAEKQPTRRRGRM